MIEYQDVRQASRSSMLAHMEAVGFMLFDKVDCETPDQLLRMGRLLGTIDVDIEESLLGPAVMSLRYDAAKAGGNDLPAYFTSDFFPLHTDVSYVPNPPRFVLMHCVHPDPNGGGATLLADCNKVRASLSAQDEQVMRSPVFRFSYPPNCTEGESRPCPVLGPGSTRFKRSGMRFPQSAENAVQRFEQLMSEVAISLSLERGDLLIIDNHRFAHGRTAFSHDASGLPGRQILRIYANTIDS